MNRPDSLPGRLPLPAWYERKRACTLKRNRLEHRPFSHFTMNGRGRPLKSYEIILNLIGGPTTRQGLQVQAALDLTHTRRN